MNSVTNYINLGQGSNGLCRLSETRRRRFTSDGDGLRSRIEEHPQLRNIFLADKQRRKSYNSYEEENSAWNHMLILIQRYSFQSVSNKRSALLYGHVL